MQEYYSDFHKKNAGGYFQVRRSAFKVLSSRALRLTRLCPQCTIFAEQEKEGTLMGQAAEIMERTKKLAAVAGIKELYTKAQTYYDAAKLARQPPLEQKYAVGVREALTAALKRDLMTDEEVEERLAAITDVSKAVAQCRDSVGWSHIAKAYINDVPDEARRELFKQHAPGMCRATASVCSQPSIRLTPHLRACCSS